MSESVHQVSKFGKQLVHTEKKYRDRAIKKLRIFIQRKNDMTELEMEKLWKALFYCMWMSDKVVIQHELAQNLSTLIHAFQTTALSLSYVEAFFKTMQREWGGIDGLRLPPRPTG